MLVTAVAAYKHISDHDWTIIKAPSTHPSWRSGGEVDCEYSVLTGMILRPCGKYLGASGSGGAPGSAMGYSRGIGVGPYRSVGDWLIGCVWVCYTIRIVIMIIVDACTNDYLEGWQIAAEEPIC